MIIGALFTNDSYTMHRVNYPQVQTLRLTG